MILKNGMQNWDVFLNGIFIVKSVFIDLKFFQSI